MMIKKHFHKDWNLNVVKTGDSVDLGDNKLIFVETPMLHWPGDYNEGTAAVLYDTMWGATKKMALSIARGLGNRGVGARVLNIGKCDRNDLITDIFRSRGVIIGSSTINKGILSSTAALLEVIKGLQFKNKIAASFGSYGWSGESIKIVEDRLREAGLEVVQEGIKMQYDPTPEDLRECEAFGEKFAGRM